MSLLNLLTVGHCLSTVMDQPSRYTMRRENLLPHFKPNPRPSHPAAFAEPASDPGGPGLASSPQPAGSPRSVEAVVSPTHPVQSADGSAQPPAARSPMARYPQGRWTVRRGPACSSTAPRQRPEFEAVQSDLPWENIPVARNDLNEADVDVVRPAQPGPPLPAASPDSLGETRKPVPGKPRGGRCWLGRLAPRWMKGNRP